ncbi:MAG: TauD/TfdA family dioxygenase, partial [Alphaproteobacteria bacterium]
MNQMVVTPLSDALGAEVTGIDAANLDDATFGRLRDALHDNIVLAVRGQALDPAAQTDFTRRFGEIQYHINSEYKMEDQPEVLILSTEIIDGKNVGIPDAGSDWHSDHSYVDRPTAYTILQSIIVPKVGGDT